MAVAPYGWHHRHRATRWAGLALLTLAATIAVPLAAAGPASASVTPSVAPPACASGDTDALANCVRSDPDGMKISNTTPVRVDHGIDGITYAFNTTVTTLPHPVCPGTSVPFEDIPCTFSGSNTGARLYQPGKSTAAALPAGINFSNPTTCSTTFTCSSQIYLDISKFNGTVTLLVSVGVNTILNTPTVGSLGFNYVDFALTVTAAALPGAPAKPTVTGGGNGTAHVSWAAPANGGSPITGYVVTPHSGFTTYPSVTYTTAATSQTITGLTNGVNYFFMVQAVNGIGTGPSSVGSGPLIAPFTTPTKFVDSVYTDFDGRTPTAAELSTGLTNLGNQYDPISYMSGFRTASDATTNVDPITRLYFAYFLRIPDVGGLTYWIGKKRTGTTEYAVSNTFAGSSEFKTKYGSLTNAAFVNLVYQNVLGRAGDAGGVSYWTSQLNAKKKTRGQVMVGFSESSEYQTKEAPSVNAAVVYIDLLGVAPTTAEFNSAIAKTITALLTTVVADARYVARAS